MFRIREKKDGIDLYTLTFEYPLGHCFIIEDKCTNSLWSEESVGTLFWCFRFLDDYIPRKEIIGTSKDSFDLEQGYYDKTEQTEYLAHELDRYKITYHIQEVPCGGIYILTVLIGNTVVCINLDDLDFEPNEEWQGHTKAYILANTLFCIKNVCNELGLQWTQIIE